MSNIFYNSRKWRNKRKEILLRDNFECMWCKEKGKVSKGKVVHHIVELKARIDLGLISTNLVTVCRPCHELHHERINQSKKFTNLERW